MSINRIQKLLFSEYCDFEDMVLIESPFAQTSREGKGIKQVHLGLTPSKLILATDIIPLASDTPVSYLPGIDPYIETFELIAVYPVECVNLSIFHRRKRQSLKAHFCNNNVLYFELGGFEKRNMFWNLWCERVQFLNPEDPGSSYSETSVASSTSNSTLYLVSSKHYKRFGKKHQIWCNFGAGDATMNECKWTEKYLLYNQADDSPLNYKPVMDPPTTSEFVERRRRNSAQRGKFSLTSSQATSCSRCRSSESQQLNRFGKGVKENCSTCLFLPDENCIVSKRFSEMTTQSADLFTLYPMLQTKPKRNYEDLAETSVKLWELYKDVKSIDLNGMKHKRRYAILPLSHFLSGLGPWNVTPGERFSIQVKRVVSSVNIRRQPNEPELRLPVSKRQLVASISCETLYLDERFNTNNSLKSSPIRPVIFFWTPEYWYRPRTAKDAYTELQNHLVKIREYHQVHDKTKKTRTSMLFRKLRKSSKELLDSCETSDDSRKRKLFSVFTNRDSRVSKRINKKEQETSLQYLRRILRMDVALTAWDFDSTTLAYQLTLIDRDLFLKIPPIELGVLLWQQSSKNAPNIGAFIAFSHRISCLVATEILKDESEKVRARLITRFINMSEKCHNIGNFQTCKSTLCGLQSLPIYRLQNTWNYVRKHHASKYLTFENLCRLYRDPRLPIYQAHVTKAVANGPYIPYIGDIIAHLLDRVQDSDEASTKSCNTMKALQHKEDYKERKHVKHITKKRNSIFTKLLSSIKEWPNYTNDNQSKFNSITRINSNISINRNRKFKKIYKQNFCHDNRILRLNKSIESLEKLQKGAANYTITINELAREYLLKARYREDRENFIDSLQLETTFLSVNR